MKRIQILALVLLLGGLALSQEKVNPGFRDDFRGKYDAAWTILNQNPNKISFKDAEFLTINTESGGIWNQYNNARNIFLIDMPANCDNFVMTTRLVKFDPGNKYQQAGLICFDDVDNYLKFTLEFDPGNGGRTLCVTPERDGISQANSFLKVQLAADDLWLRIVKSDQAYLCAASRDGKDFKTVGVLNWKDGLSAKVGLIAKNGVPMATPGIDANFDFFEIVPLKSKPDIMTWVNQQTEF